MSAQHDQQEYIKENIQDPDPRPMTLVHMDVDSSSVSSIEGFNHAMLITYSCMQTKKEVLLIVSAQYYLSLALCVVVINASCNCMG